MIDAVDLLEQTRGFRAETSLQAPQTGEAHVGARCVQGALLLATVRGLAIRRGKSADGSGHDDQ